MRISASAATQPVGPRVGGNALDAMTAQLGQLQHRAADMGAPQRVDAADADSGDAHMDTMLSMLGAMQEMQLAPGAALGARPAVA